MRIYSTSVNILIREREYIAHSETFSFTKENILRTPKYSHSRKRIYCATRNILIHEREYIAPPEIFSFMKENIFQLYADKKIAYVVSSVCDFMNIEQSTLKMLQ